MGLPSCEPTVCDRALELLDCLGVDIFWGDNAKGGGAPPRVLMGEETAEDAFWRFDGSLGPSKKLPGAKELPDWCERLEELLEVLRRPSPFCPATNDTRSGEDGWDALLGDEFD